MKNIFEKYQQGKTNSYLFAIEDDNKSTSTVIKSKDTMNEFFEKQHALIKEYGLKIESYGEFEAMRVKLINNEEKDAKKLLRKIIKSGCIVDSKTVKDIEDILN